MDSWLLWRAQLPGTRTRSGTRGVTRGGIRGKDPVSRYTHILFDHDGVLVDTEPLYFRATQQALADLEVDLELDDYLQLQAHGANAWERASDRGASDEEIAAGRAARNRRYQELLLTEDIDIHGVEGLLDRLSATHTLAIVTTAKPDDFALIHRSRDIVRHMDLILTNGDYPRSKPHPDPYLEALNRFGIEASAALVERPQHVELHGAAVAAGIDCAVVHHPFTAPQDFSAATYRLKTLGDLLSLL